MLYRAKNSMIRSVIFDLGGTLIDYFGSAADWRSFEERGIAALYPLLVERGFALPKSEFSEAIWNAVNQGWQEAMAGRANARLPELLGASLASFGLTLDEEALMQAARVYAAGVSGEIVPLDGAAQVLCELKRRGLRLGLLSNTTWPADFHLRDMRQCGLPEVFDVAVFSSETGLWKPNASAFHAVTNQLNVSPGEAVFVGDQLHIDVLGAQRAGLRAVWISADGSKPGNVQPDAVIHRLAELPGVLDRLASNDRSLLRVNHADN